ncbi:cell wall-associated NlpC family hydrolase [Pullulanibacillus pueri]|uniref:NlpC/P60 domain-containing protein n=1 Tax=Pullulanibacillus pueri TaxID=1437324 RepID=A0A8J2ZTD7_9BACL|nr:peptidoglycan-binding protein [Pullulanibacillus pueri]MBM7681879.1 cell wall-associated NlpC family hydrolase [Pullulanibacillus pueri]GGH76448.1 hypothetical protein GCM10007096_06890 [Pullulanibacillus pueri]
MKLPAKKLVISSIVAASFVVLPQIGGHHSSAKAAAINTNQVLHYGESDSSVKALQDKLQDLNYYKSTIDGIYGNQTRSAVRSFQGDNNLAVDGIAGPNTLGKLFSAKVSTQKVSNDVTLTTNLKYGDRGQAVKDLQSTLNNLGYHAGTVDGIFGSTTLNAVKSFQKAQGLQSDGIVGPNTRAALAAPKTTSTPKKTNSNVNAIIADAKALIGVPYVYGGTTTKGFDCSGFTQYVFAENGISLPRTAAAQWNGGTKVNSPSKGDLVFFATVNNGPSHVGIYLGNNQFINASSSHGVTISDMNNSYWKPRYLGARSYN